MTEKLRRSLEKSRDFWIDHLEDSAELLEQNDENATALAENLKAIARLQQQYGIAKTATQ